MFFKAPFTLELYFEILFQNNNFEIFLLKVSTFTLEINIVIVSFDVCKHWPIDQSQCFINEISSAKFHKIEHVIICEIEFQNLLLSKVNC